MYDPAGKVEALYTGDVVAGAKEFRGQYTNRYGLNTAGEVWHSRPNSDYYGTCGYHEKDQLVSLTTSMGTV